MICLDPYFQFCNCNYIRLAVPCKKPCVVIYHTLAETYHAEFASNIFLLNRSTFTLTVIFAWKTFIR